MSVTATYIDDLSRVRVSCAGAPAAADFAKIERSADGITWATVRGGDAVALGPGGTCVIDDYEFDPGVTNIYRASYVDSAMSSLSAIGAVETGNNATVTPGIPSGALAGDHLVLVAAHRNTSASVSTPTGWTLRTDGGNFRIFTRRYTTGLAAPTVAFTGGAAGEDTMARIVALRNAVDDSWSYQVNPSAQDIPVNAHFLPRAAMVLRIGWKAAASTSSNLPDFTVVAHSSTTGTSPQTLTMWRQTYFGGGTIPAQTITVTGGAAAVSKSVTIRFAVAPYVTQETATVVPAMDRPWLKNPLRPYLNRPLTVIDWSDVERPARSGVFDIIGSPTPVAVTDLRGSRRYTLTVTVPDLGQAADLDGCLAAGEPILLHVPAGCRFPGMYAVVGDTKMGRPPARRSVRRYLDLPLTEVAPPASTMVPTTVTWQGIINTFATWADLIAAEPTWGDVADRIGTPADVVVP
ncbi:hypothetical protein [Actinokineospora spheciospongiae]|uniref:hypothetical protein n=1 Tax=Actinokineospora spheciospongiae TaxID=909613 RepID=UPI000D70DEB2|nr:hypothetical protein [Actinokineospora spheciospongiae]